MVEDFLMKAYVSIEIYSVLWQYGNDQPVSVSFLLPSTVNADTVAERSFI